MLLMEEYSVDDSDTVWGRSQSDKILRNDNADDESAADADDIFAQGELLDQPAKRAWGDFHPIATPSASPIWFQFKGEWGGRDGVSGDNPTHVLVTIWERPTYLSSNTETLPFHWVTWGSSL